MFPLVAYLGIRRNTYATGSAVNAENQPSAWLFHLPKCGRIYLSVLSTTVSHECNQCTGKVLLPNQCWFSATIRGASERWTRNKLQIASSLLGLRGKRCIDKLFLSMFYLCAFRKSRSHKNISFSNLKFYRMVFYVITQNINLQSFPTFEI